MLYCTNFARVSEWGYSEFFTAIEINDNGAGSGDHGVIQMLYVNIIDSTEIGENYEPGKSSLDWSGNEIILMLVELEMHEYNWELFAEHMTMSGPTPTYSGSCT